MISNKNDQFFHGSIKITLQLASRFSSLQKSECTRESNVRIQMHVYLRITDQSQFKEFMKVQGFNLNSNLSFEVLNLSNCATGSSLTSISIDQNIVDITSQVTIAGLTRKTL